MNILSIYLALTLSFNIFLTSEKFAESPKDIVDISKTIQSDWIWLFDGTNLDHWVKPGENNLPKKGWSIENKILIVNKGGEKKNRGGSIITKEKYGNFDLNFEFKMTPGANSGIKYFVKNYPDRGILGCEYQIIDDEGNKDIANDVDGTRLTAGLYELFEAKGKQLNPPGEWNKGRIVVNGKHVEHWLNDIMVLEYERGSKAFLDARAKSKFKDVSDFGLIEEGYILLQDHGDEMAYRNIRIKRL